jgi:hypothetical protein
LGLELLGLLLATIGIFYIGIIVAYIVLASGFFIYILFRNIPILSLSKNLKFYLIAIVSFLFILLFAHYSVPTIFSGRDQGSLSEAAIRLAENHKLTFSSPASEEFFHIYGPGQALNFPGFDYTKDGQLTTQFPLGYAVWLAIFYSLFGLNGLIIANGITLFIFLLSFFLIAGLYLKTSSSVWVWLLALTSFSFMWFFKFTLSENLALAMIWFGLWEFLIFLRNEEPLYLFASLLSFIALAFTRIEAWAILPMVFIALYLKYRSWKTIREKMTKKLFLIPLILVIILFIISLEVNFSFYRTFAKGFLSAFSPPKNEVDIPSYSLTFATYLVRVLGLYTILNFLVLAFMGIIFFLKNKKYELLTIAFISLPVLIYLINPSISSDHPWMLRRFVFVVLPMAILYSVLFLDKFFSRKIFTSIILFLLLVMNLIVFIPYISRADNENLLSETQSLSHNFTNADLVLVDRDASGSGWSMVTGPMSFLYGKQAVYFFNPSDLAKIDTKKFSSVYLIVPDTNFDYYVGSGMLSKFSLVKDYKIETSSLDIKTGKKNDIYSQPVEFPQEQKTIVYGKIFKLN